MNVFYIFWKGVLPELVSKLFLLLNITLEAFYNDRNTWPKADLFHYSTWQRILFYAGNFYLKGSVTLRPREYAPGIY